MNKEELARSWGERCAVEPTKQAIEGLFRSIAPRSLPNDAEAIDLAEYMLARAVMAVAADASKENLTVYFVILSALQPFIYPPSDGALTVLGEAIAHTNRCIDACAEDITEDNLKDFFMALCAADKLVREHSQN